MYIDGALVGTVGFDENLVGAAEVADFSARLVPGGRLETELVGGSPVQFSVQINWTSLQVQWIGLWDRSGCCVVSFSSLSRALFLSA